MTLALLGTAFSFREFPIVHFGSYYMLNMLNMLNNKKEVIIC